MRILRKLAPLALVDLALYFGIATCVAYVLIVFSSCALPHPFRSAPSVAVLYQGTAEKDWPGLERALDVALDVFREDYPDHPELLDFEVVVIGEGDRMDAVGRCRDVPGTKYSGCADRDCSPAGLSCRWVVTVRQLHQVVNGPPGRDRLAPAGGTAPPSRAPLLEACDDSVDGGCPILYELADRAAPLRLGWPNYDIVHAHEDPRCVALRRKMLARYKERAAS